MPTPDSIYGALTPDIAAGAGALPSDALIAAMERIARARQGQMGVVPAPPAPAPPIGPPPGPQSSLPPMPGSPSMQYASTGQQYRPPASFDARFGPYLAQPGMTEDEMTRRALDQMRFRKTPDAIMPGSRTWPEGYIRSEAPLPMQLAGDVVPLQILYQNLDRVRQNLIRERMQYGLDNPQFKDLSKRIDEITSSLFARRG